MTARRVFLCVATLVSLVLPGLVHGQTSQSALAGVARDSTGGVLPGVAVEAASPALIERVRAVTIRHRAGTGSCNEVQQPFTPPVRGQ